MNAKLYVSGALLFLAAVLAADISAAGANHRYIVERSFPKGALDGLDADAKADVNRNNSRYGVHWVMSYANAERTRTYCVYEGPNEQAVRDAAAANRLPVDAITEVPVTLDPK